jgi:hypothetical protein
MRRKTAYHLSAKQLQSLQTRMEEMRRQRYLLECMQAEFERYIADETGVDLRTGEWLLDLDRATLTRPPGVQTSPQ